MIEIICSGIGGQGVLVAGMVLADIAMEDGKNVSWYPSYGFEMRGGAANCEVKIGDEDLPDFGVRGEGFAGQLDPLREEEARFPPSLRFRQFRESRDSRVGTGRDALRSGFGGKSFRLHGVCALLYF